jgi:uncharacterized protein (TIGR01777 family)
MKVVITGASGFIGTALCRELHDDYDIIALSRNVEASRESLDNLAEVVPWDAKTSTGWENEAEGAFAIINLAGENLSTGRWTNEKKSRIMDSRVNSIQALIETVGKIQKKPEVVVLTSAVGYYGTSLNEQFDETSGPGEGFLAGVCRRIESFSEKFEKSGIRCVIIRPGVVLGKNAGALEKMAGPVRFFLGGYPGSGRQWFSWISLFDAVKAIRFLIEYENFRGAFNLTSPKPVTMKEFYVTLGKVMNRPVWLRIPGFVLRAALGEMAEETILSGQKVLPGRLLEADFKFKYADLEKALENIIEKGS